MNGAIAPLLRRVIGGCATAVLLATLPLLKKLFGCVATLLFLAHAAAGLAQTNQPPSKAASYYYDKNDRLIGMESTRGVSLGYAYDGNGNILRQIYLSRDPETNGLPVLWRFLNGLSWTDNSGTNATYADADGDGWSNYAEWLAGSNPIGSNSVPAMGSVTGAVRTIVVPGTNVLGASAQVPIRITNLLGNASIPFLQYSFLPYSNTYVIPARSADFGSSNTSSFLSVNADMVGGGPVTFAFWVKFSALVPNTSQPLCQHSSIDLGQNGVFYDIYVNVFSPTNLNLVANRAYNNVGHTISALGWNPGTSVWSHVAYTFDGSNEHLYINGSEAAAPRFVPGDGTPGPVGFLHISGPAGFSGNPILPLSGKVDDFRVYNADVGASAVAALYASPSPVMGNETNLVAGYTFDSDLTTDSTSNHYNLSISNSVVQSTDVAFVASTNIPDSGTNATILQVNGTNYSPSLRVTALPSGSDHILSWNAFHDLGPLNTNVWLRARAVDAGTLGDWSPGVLYAVNTLAGSHNGVPDWWSLKYFGQTAIDPNADADGDGFNNYAEYVAGTDPLNSNSYLRITGILNLGGGAQINWQGGTQARQILQRTSGLEGTNSWLNLQTNEPPTPLGGSYLDVLNTNSASFYRIRVERP